MGTLAQGNWLTHALHRLPHSWLAVLDAWSYRVAVKRRERRRLAGLRRRLPAPIPYKLKPWRD
jgi:hypothetical protein